jgi:hypothetical protein
MLGTVACLVLPMRGDLLCIDSWVDLFFPWLQFPCVPVATNCTFAWPCHAISERGLGPRGNCARASQIC